MEEYVVYSLFLVIIFTGQGSAGDYPEAEVAYCQPYCDVFGYYKSGAWCISNYGPVYCCGNENFRYCCDDPSEDVTDKYPEVTKCPNSSWWVYHWRVIIGLLGTLMMVLIVSSCCYYCCVHALSRRRRNTARSTERETELPSVVSNGSEAATGGATFDPQHPYAFVPPDYDSLPKEPPKYAEVFERDSANAHTNDAFELDVPPPPPPQEEGHSVVEEPGTPPPKYEDVPVHTTNIPEQSNVPLNPFTGLPVDGAASIDPVNPSAT